MSLFLIFKQFCVKKTIYQHRISVAFCQIPPHCENTGTQVHAL